MKKTAKKPVLALTMGDPCGIGPEVILRALAARRARAAARFVVFGSEAVLRRVAETFAIRLPRFSRVEASNVRVPERTVAIVDEVPCPASLAFRGRVSKKGGEASFRWIVAAIDAALAGSVDAVVTGPISKEAVAKAGHDWSGHTEILAARTGARKPVMTMVGGGLRVALATTHIAIADLPRAITRGNVLRTLRVVHEDMKRYFGIRQPRLAVCGLNPHAGEAGRFGTEERTAIAPAIRRARREGVLCEGPVPADVAFTRTQREKHDAVVAMYHDQATIPVKTLAFDRGVNVTLGLPIVRTSPDHGTAFDIAARGVANPGSMIAAIRMAARMARCGRRR